MNSPAAYEYQGFPNVSFSSPIPTSRATKEALDAIYARKLPFVPCVGLPCLETEIADACPPSIRELWNIPEHALIGNNSREGSSHTSTLVPQVESDQNEQILRAISNLIRALLPDQNVSRTSNSPFPITIREADSASPSPGPSSSHTTPRRRVGDTPPTPSPLPSMQASPISSRHGDRAEGRRAIGRALVSARDRVAIEEWMAGVKNMQGIGICLDTFYEILSLGLQGKGGVRDI
ncbi:hypothetical protein SVAN01_07842 [Stagonosporopsis vannaccii]|nr:hypothetical protein SVAN01_07842 [Stagonosporopsis vannaccii]